VTELLAGLFGLLIGSFLNVCIYRVPRDMGIITPRSFCPECGAPVIATNNIPILSFVLLRGRCKSCQKPISWRYPLVELLTAVLFAAIVGRYGVGLVAVKWLIFESLMIVLFWTDWEERLLPDEFTWGGLTIGLALSLVVNLPSPLLDLLMPMRPPYSNLAKAGASAVFLSLPIWFVGFAYSKLRKREGLGLGDVKLLLTLGAFLGLETGLSAMLLASLAGSVFGAFLLFRHRRSALDLELPFGSFLCAAAAAMPLWKLLV
jgi:leader peptidase (prepilin peptidase) / N-methyltransferase